LLYHLTGLIFSVYARSAKGSRNGCGLFWLFYYLNSQHFLS
jgi:hypothetical protein